MRSRDGNSNLLRRLCAVALCSSLPLSASEYLISYKYIVENITLYNETLLISEAMKKCNGKPQKEFVLYSNESRDLREVISQNSEEFIEYIHKLGLHVEHKEITTNLQNRSTTTLILKTTCFKVDFNDNFVKIAPLK
jgi:hypothetical protein